MTQPPELPDPLWDVSASAPAPIAHIAAEYRDLRDRANTACRTLLSLEDRRPAALTADRDALAAAHRTGEADPGDANADGLNAQIATAERELSGLTDAAFLAWREFRASLAEHGHKWRESLQVANAKRVGPATELIDSLDQVVTDVARA